MPKLLLATNNLGKVRELKSILDDIGLELVTPQDLGLRLDVVEDGVTYFENAARKAVAFADASGLVALADDSGLEVDALGGAPGLHSARFSPKPGATDTDRREVLLQKLQDRPRPWTARFRSVIAIAGPGEEIQYAEGVCEGQIIPQERGQNGFGYDPIFLLPDAGLTMAELTDDAKNRLSHRALAAQAARPGLVARFGI